MGKVKTIAGALSYMQEVDPNGTWDEACEELVHGTDALDSEIAYMIETLQAWQGELETDDRMSPIMQYWIDRLKLLVE